MDLKLRGKKAIVTGSTAGIGLAIAETLAKEGASVVLNGRTEARVTAAIETVRKLAQGGDITGVAADLGTPSGVERFVSEVPTADILVNNLGIFEAKPFGEITDIEWTKFFEVNVMSGVRLSRHYLPRMLAANWGRIIFISSESSINPPAEMIHYGMTKTAQLAISRGLAESTAGTAVTVNAVLPGPTKSEGVATFVEGLAKSSGKDAAAVEKYFFRTMRPSSLLKRFIDTDEVASLVAYIASPTSSAINGAALRVDGGVVRSIV